MKSIKTIVITAAISALLTGCQPTTDSNANRSNAGNSNANTSSAATPPTKEALMTLERSAFDAWKNKDGKFWDTFLSDKFVGYGQAGRLDKASATKEYTGANCDIKSATLSDDQMTYLEPDAAIVTYKAVVDGTCEGQKLPANGTWAASVYVRDGNSWRGAFHAETPIVDPNAAPAAPAAPAAKPATPAVETSPGDDEAAASETVTKQDDGGLMALERRIWDAWKNKDAKAMDALLASNYVFVQGTGRSDRPTVMKMWIDDNKCQVSDINLTEAQPVVLTSNVSLLTYKGSAGGTCEGKPIPTEWYAAVDVRDSSGWKGAFGMSVPQ